MGRRAPAGARDRGGAVVPALGTPGARVAAAVSSLAALAVLAAYPVAAADRLAGLLAAGGAAAALFLGVALVARVPPLVPAALALVGAEYGGLTYLGGGARGFPAAAAGLVLSAELAYWALEPASRAAGTRGAAIAFAALGGGAASTLVASLSDEPFRGGLAVEAGGVAAAVLAVAFVVVLARSRATSSR